MDNTDLEKLKVIPGRLVPKFKNTVTEYSVIVASGVSEVKLTPLTSDSGASYTIKGDATSKTVQLTEGTTSVIEIVVTAEDGHSTKTYTISIQRLSPSDACLSQLDVSAGSLQPPFSPSTLVYYCDLPSNLTSLTLRTKTEDLGMKTTLKDGSPVGTVTLAAGLTIIEIVVTSVNGNVTTTYTINAIRLQCPYPVILKNTQDLQFICTACTGIVHCPCKVKDSDEGIYCQKCLLELSRVNKANPLTGGILGEGWMIIDHGLDAQLSSQDAICVTPFGKIETKIGEIPALVAQKKKTAEANDSCTDCSKKVLSGLLEVHKHLSCSSKLSESLPKTEVKELYWQKRYVDDSLPSNLDTILKTAKEWEQKYIILLRTQDSTHFSSADILELLSKAASCYATAIRTASKDSSGHIGLGLVMEELFYIEDLYGHKPTESRDGDDDETEAERTSKEEEFLAICELHGVSATANLALQLKAVETEYLSLKEAGQSHRSEQVQKLYQWKSKKALQASKGSYSVESESPLYKAKVKFEHAVSLNPSDHTACYHLGRLSLLLGELAVAEKCLKVAASIKPTHAETLLCLGQAVAQSNPSQAKGLLEFGIGVYLHHREEIAEGIMQPSEELLHGVNFWRPTNTLIGESLLTLANLGGHTFLDPRSCFLLAARLFSATPGLLKGSTVQQLLWIMLRGRAGLLERALKDKVSYASTLCQQISALITHCQLPPTEQLRETQMKVFENGAVLQPTNTLALTHLGNGQLQQFEATGDKIWLTLAEQTFRASLACEGKAMDSGEPPSQLTQQEWWKKRNTVPPTTMEIKPSAGATSAKPSPTGKQAPSKPSVTQPASRSKPQVTPLKSQPVAGKGRQTGPASKPGPVAGRGRGGIAPSTSKIQPGTGRGKTVATLGELKASQKGSTTQAKPDTTKTLEKAPEPDEVKSSASSTPTTPVRLNETTYLPRLGLARALAKQEGKASDECIALYRDVIKMAPNVHDAYIELGELLAKSDPVGAVEVYSQFPFADPPSLDDAYLHGEIVRLLMSSASYDDPRLATSMIAMGRALGIGVLDRHVSTLEAKFKSNLLKKVYAGVHGKLVDDPDLQAFFKFKCWT